MLLKKLSQNIKNSATVFYFGSIFFKCAHTIQSTRNRILWHHDAGGIQRMVAGSPQKTGRLRCGKAVLAGVCGMAGQ